MPLRSRLRRRAAALLLPTFLAAGIGTSCNAVQTPRVQDSAQEPVRFDAARAWKHLETIVAHGPRPSGSQAIEATRQTIERELRRLGLATRRERFDATTPAGRITFQNVICDLPTHTADAPVVVLATHFDTKRLDFHFVGANDGGSGTAVLLELARVLAADKVHPVRYRLLFLDGEEALRSFWAGEDNCYGSRHHVRELERKGELDQVGACVLLDMVGDRDLVLVEEGFSTRELLEIFFDAAEELGLAAHTKRGTRNIRDDHQRFLEAGVPSVNLIDFDYGERNRHWHQAGDTLEHCSQESLGVIGRIVLAGLPAVEAFVLRERARDEG